MLCLWVRSKVTVPLETGISCCVSFPVSSLKIVFSFGASTRASVCAEAMVALRGVTEEFPEEVIQQADEIANAPIPKEAYETRLDLRSTPIFTIDSAQSKDLDDAVSLEKTENGYRLGVHIADVSH